MELIQGFDDRDWNGYLSPELAKEFKFIGIKASQGKSWNPIDRSILQRQWRRAKDPYNLLRIPFHFLISPTLLEDPEVNGVIQADNFHQSMKKWNDPAVYGWGELPPCIDVEDRFTGMAGPKSRAISLLNCLEVTENLWGRVPIIYTATWYWDTHVHPEFVKLVPEYWKIYDLWEADPDPATTIAGWGDTNSIQQYKLNIPYPGYGSNVLDLDETTKAWITKRLNELLPDPPPPPPPPPPLPSGCEKQEIAMRDAIVTLEKGLEV